MNYDTNFIILGNILCNEYRKNTWVQISAWPVVHDTIHSSQFSSTNMGKVSRLSISDIFFWRAWKLEPASESGVFWQPLRGYAVGLFHLHQWALPCQVSCEVHGILPSQVCESRSAHYVATVGPIHQKFFSFQYTALNPRVKHDLWSGFSPAASLYSTCGPCGPQ